MEAFPKNFGFQRILIQLRHMQLRNLVRKGNISLLRKIKNRSLSFPSTILVEVTNDCMLNCIMCPHSQLKDKTGYMPFDLLKKIIDECSRHYSLRDLVFSGIGEPLLHSQLLEMSKFTKRKGIPKVRLITNGILLTMQKTEEIFEDSGFDCCMDAFKKLKIGNIRKSSIKELWNTPLLQQIRQIHLQGRYQEIPLCSQCENWWYLGEEPKER